MFRRFGWASALLAAAALTFVGCTGDTGPAGPAGPPGEDGADGADGTSVTTCMDCHTDATSLQIFLEYAQSGHKAGEYVSYAGGRSSCAQCHGKQGFIEYAVTGDVEENIADPVAIDCATCHVVHPEVFALRLSGPVTLISDPAYSLDFGDNSNLCANCHQTRRAEPNIAAPADSFEITSTHYGPHHGPQANVLEGVGFAEIPGSVAYPTPKSSPHLSLGATCVTCHMALPANNQGGHTWAASLNLCNGCHAGATDFDVNGAQTATQAKLDALRDRLVELGVVEYVEEDEAYEPIVGKYPMIQAQAFYNWIGLVEDRSLSVHNLGYYEALLDNTLEALAPPTP